MRLISYSLWGKNPKYTIGAIKNAELASKHYPGWVCRFYCADSVPLDIIATLKNFSNVQIIQDKTAGDWKSTVNRFLPISENIELMISRDTDSRFTEREVIAVQKWIESDKSAHIMRDHPYHGGFPMLAGMFGIRGGVIKNIKALLSLMSGVETQYHYDQIFLSKYVYPYVENSIMIHDSFFTSNPFPTKRNGLEFVGQAFDEYDNPCNPEHAELVKNK